MITIRLAIHGMSGAILIRPYNNYTSRNVAQHFSSARAVPPAHLSVLYAYDRNVDVPALE